MCVAIFAFAICFFALWRDSSAATGGAGGAVAPPAGSWNVQFNYQLPKGPIVVQAWAYDGYVFDFCDIVCTNPLVVDSTPKGKLDGAHTKDVYVDLQVAQQLASADYVYQGAQRQYWSKFKAGSWDGFSKLRYKITGHVDGVRGKIRLRLFKVKIRYNDTARSQVPLSSSCEEIRCPN